jgi:flagellin-like hook-associated protein FlgL
MTQEYASAMVTNTLAARSTLVAIDEAAETLKYTDADIRQQSAIAMIAQANVSRQAVIGLFA